MRTVKEFSTTAIKNNDIQFMYSGIRSEVYRNEYIKRDRQR